MLNAFQQFDPQSAYQPELWQQANRDIIAKILTELLYEELLTPSELEKTSEQDPNLIHYQLDLPPYHYRFSCKQRAYFGFQRVLADSIKRFSSAAPQTELTLGDVFELFTPLASYLGMKSDTQAYAMREISNTLLGDLHQLAGPRLTNAELLAGDENLIESQLIAHPWIIANKGRLGFSYRDYLQHAPEMRPQAPLLWIAVDKNLASYQAITRLPYEVFIKHELAPSCLHHFEQILINKGLTPSDYYYMPVHPWQWNNELISLFMGDIIAKRIVPLDASADHYQPQQSIRTFSNLDNKLKHYVKLPISILNTSVYRGIPPERVKIAPTLSQWLLDHVAQDPFLKHEAKFILLGEVATMNVDHPHFSQLAGVPYQFREKLAVVWRESLHAKMAEGERAIPLAALLHRDKHGEPLLAALIAESGLSVSQWIKQFLKVTLEPLIHVLYKFGFVFSPHGQNALLVINQGVPARLAVKDFVDDANICADELPEHADLPQALHDILESLEGPILIQWIQSGLFVCVFRYLTEILVDDLDYDEHRFWAQVRATVLNYQARFPELAARFHAFDLLRPAFPKLCLNRVRLLDKGYADDAERPSAAIASLLDNPLYQGETQE
ncbi:IucA/IucC family protein [Motilimonas sp. KMU-193]|uniref:IucA/IucC family protein n=1 Tax=Motilimonas sp. KMU-193 TaxID=3388668 RepID=UPI00396B22FE